MARFLAVFAWCTLTLLCRGQDVELASILKFEASHTGEVPAGWGGGPTGTIFADNMVVHGGKWSARIERQSDSPGSFSSITKTISGNVEGRTIQLRGFLRTEGVKGSAGLWLREDGDAPSLAFDNMQGRDLKGTNDWAEYSISLRIHPEANRFVFGVIVSGTGKAWADDLQLLVDGKPIWEALPKLDKPKTALDVDHEFDAGSGIVLNELSKIQIDNLATLGKVWGFLKYHHPAVTAGTRQWDFDLFRVMPAILAAPDRAAANQSLFKWIAGLGGLDACGPCAHLEASEMQLRPALEWLSDESALGPDLSRSLRAIYAARPPEGKQFYVSLVPSIGNPNFLHELGYAQIKPGDSGFQILATFRFWNIIEYWFPYRDVLGENWDAVLEESIPKIALAKTRRSYEQELMMLIARAHDTHANLWSSLGARPPTGSCSLPIAVRFVENEAVVSNVRRSEVEKDTSLRQGDIVGELDGIPISTLVERRAPYYAASNEPTRLRDVATSLTRGECGDVAIRVRRGNEELTLKAQRVPNSGVDLDTIGAHDLAGETFRRLSDDVAYIKIRSLKIAEVRQYIEAAQNTKGLIIDIRNYPSEFVLFMLGSVLVDRPTMFVRFTQGDLSNPGAFHWNGQHPSLVPQTLHYSGKVVILVDEVTQSSAEYTAMALRTAPGAKIVGSTTAGADGNVSEFALPGGLRSMISGIGVFYPDKRPTQRIGILPDVEAKPTIAGIRAGRDEVLEEAVRQISGPDIPQEQVEKIANK